MAKYQKYAKYKDSGSQWLGEVPNHWKVEYSKWLFAERNIKATASDEMLTASQKYGVIPQKLFMELEQQKVVQVLSGHDILKKAEANDFVISMRSFQGGIEFSEYSGAVSSAYVPLQPKKGLSLSYYKYLFKSVPYIQSLQTTTNLVRDGQALRYGNFIQVRIPLLPFEEAEKIGQFLDHETAKIDRLIVKQEQLIALLQEKRQAVISHAVTKGLNPDATMKDSGVEWLGYVPEHWKVAGFKKYLSSIVDYRGKTPDKIDDGVFLVTARNIKKGNIDYSLSQEYVSRSDYDQIMSRGLPAIGDVLFTTEAPLGEVSQVDRTDIALAQRIIKFRGQSNVLDNTFLKYFIISNAFQDSLMTFASGSTALGIKAERLGYLMQLVPPFSEQRQIVNYIELRINKLDMLIKQTKLVIRLIQERRSALISATVTGKIDVRNWQTPDEAVTAHTV